MKKQLAIITMTALLGLTLNSSLVLADTVTTDTTQPTITTSSSTDPSQTTTPATTGTSTGTTTDTTSGTATSTSQLPPVQDSNGQTVAPGTLPDSPFYWLTNFIQKIELALTFNPVQKASLAEQQALQKLAAAEAMAKKGKADLAQKTLNEYSDKISQAETFLTQIKDPNSDTAKALEIGLAQTSAANIAVLSGLLDKLPPQAAQKVALNVVRSLEKVVNQVENKEEQPNKVKDKAKTALSMLEKMYGTTNTDTNTNTNTSTDNSGTTTQTTTSANQAVTGSTSSNTTGSVGEQNKSPMAKEREKGQQGSLMSNGYSDKVNQAQPSQPNTVQPTAVQPQPSQEQKGQDINGSSQNSHSGNQSQGGR